ncbi:serine/threonine-protein kinase [Nonomuraea sp. NPDC050536]|uniref:serine/threonine-protein kinase n=1 Tax=Nonomuraea sp. NPDC050536 TaxID=3364366 RepID=UPI0037CBB258
MPRLVGGMELGGRYRLEVLIGRGGMGEVWRAVDQRLRRPVAVKVLPAELAADQESVARFTREAEATATLQHPGITVVFDIGQDGGLTYLVMELLEGEDLRELIDRHPHGLPVDRAVSLTVQLAEALAAAHSRGIVHRDIKPANLFVLRDGRLKLCDFGIAGLADAATRITQDGGSIGTPLYMAPEQFRGDPADPRSDLYALGCVLQELLTGSPPFQSGSGLPGLLYSHLNEAPPSVRERRPDVPPELERLVFDLLAKSTDGRPPGAAAVASFLRRTAPAGTLLLPSTPPPTRVDVNPLTVSATAPLPRKSRKGLAVAGTALAVAAVVLTATAFVVANNWRAQTPSGVSARSTQPTPTPSPSKPAIHQIVYKVTGSVPTGTIFYMHPDGGSSSQTTKLPWSLKLKAKSFNFLTVGANTGLADGTIRCSITVDGKVVQDHSSRGRFASASCQYSPYLAGYTAAPLPWKGN